MEKISLKPAVKELVHKNGEEGVYFDVLAYQGASNQEKALGSFFVVGQIKYSDEDLSYAVSLLSSLAKREYYSEQSVLNQNAKRAFEHALGKLNEVLEDFFQNKNLKLNIGLLAISGSDIYISRLGKFKIALARDDKFIDVLNNVDLFNKDTEDAKQFSNIISGKLHPKDKLFAYFPTRSVVAREKQLNDIFVKEDQAGFSQKVAHLASNANNFSCCGVHINMGEIKEIPVETRPNYSRPSLTNQPAIAGKTEPRISLKTAAKSRDEGGQDEKLTEMTDDTEITSETATETSIENSAEQVHDKPDSHQQESPRIIPAEFTLSKRKSLLTSAGAQFYKISSISRLNFKAKSRSFLIIVAIVVVPLLAFVAFRSLGPTSEVKNAINKAEENLRLAQSRLNQNDTKEARILLQAAISNTADISNKETAEINKEINTALAGINRLNDKEPQLYSDVSSVNQALNAKAITAYKDSAVIADNAGTIFSLSQGGVSELAQLKASPNFLFGGESTISVFNGSELFGIYNLETKKSEIYSLKEPASVLDAVLYQDNLYTLADNNIYKYADAVTGGTKKTVWVSDSTSGNLVLITADGNIYALNSNGKLIKYFKGKKDGEFDLQVIPTSGSRIFTFKDSAFIYLADKISGLVYIFDKANGELKTTYSFASVGSINSISVSPDGTIWALSADNKVWMIK